MSSNGLWIFGKPWARAGFAACFVFNILDFDSACIRTENRIQSINLLDENVILKPDKENVLSLSNVLIVKHQCKNCSQIVNAFEQSRKIKQCPEIFAKP